MPTEPDKTAEAVIHLCNLSADDPNLDRSKLVNLLYYADAAAYTRHGQPITDITYRHFPGGPLPDGCHLIRKRMEQNGDITVLYDRSGTGYHNYRITPNRPADLEMLSPTDCEHLVQQVHRFAQYNTAGMTQYAQEEVAWLSTEDGEPMSYELHGVVAAPLSANMIRIAAPELGIDETGT